MTTQSKKSEVKKEFSELEVDYLKSKIKYLENCCYHLKWTIDNKNFVAVNSFEDTLYKAQKHLLDLKIKITSLKNYNL